MGLKPSTYVKPAPAEKENPFLDAVKEYTDKGVDTAFENTTTAAEYEAEKLQIQAAVRAQGFSARVVQTNFSKDLADKSPVTAVFQVRPPRKERTKKGAEDTAAEDSGE